MMEQETLFLRRKDIRKDKFRDEKNGEQSKLRQKLPTRVQNRDEKETP
jgi:hypothetical protein